MMKFKKFPDMTHAIMSRMAEKGKPPVNTEIPVYSHDGWVVACVEVNKDDLQRMRDNGQIFIVLGPNVGGLPPMILQTENPFVKQEAKTIKLNGKNHGKESSDKESPGDN